MMVIFDSNVSHEEKKARIIVERHTMNNFVRYLTQNKSKVPALEKLIQKYKLKRRFPDMRDFRLGPHKIDEVPFDWIMLFSIKKNKKNAQLRGHAMLTRIYWDHNPCNIPDGWQGSVRRSYEDSVINNKKVNTLAGMFVQVEQDSRKQGWATTMVREMISFGKEHGLSSLIIPLRLPQRYEKEYARMPYEEFAFLKREDGQFKDHWLRLHTRLGAKILGVCHTSHRHAMSLKDFYQQIKVPAFSSSGNHLIKQSDEWYQVYVDLEREFVLINQGCVWVQHNLT